MYNYRFLLLFVLCAYGSNFNAAQLREVEHTQTVAIELSSKDPNIISVDNDRIKQYSTLKGLVTASIDTDSGFINIKPTSTQDNRPFSIIVITEKGSRYTLIASPKKIPAQDIILNQAKKETNLNARVEYGETLTSLLQAMIENTDIATYQKILADEAKELKNYFDGRNELALMSLYKGDKNTGEVIIFNNSSDQSIKLNEEGFYGSNVLAVSLTAREVQPGESVKIYRVVSNV